MSCGSAGSQRRGPPPRSTRRRTCRRCIWERSRHDSERTTFQMTFAIQFLIDVLSLGGAYALMALGLVIVYGILRLVNFAYGELIMVAGYTMFLVSGSALPWLVMAVVAVAMAVLAGIATDYIAFRPVRA